LSLLIFILLDFEEVSHIYEWFSFWGSAPYYNAITESDGSFRDINFRPKTAAEAKSIFDLFTTLFRFENAHEEEGNTLKDIAAIKSHIENLQYGFVHSSWASDNTWISQIQIFLDRDTEGFECEISLFPDDIDKSVFSMQMFLEFLSILLRTADTREYYVRFENCSWHFGKCSRYSAVIFSHEDINILP
jgi:hypothetical protein